MCRFTVLLAAMLIILFNSTISAATNNHISRLSNRQIVFTENRGQWDERVLFKAEASGGLTWFLERDGFTLLYTLPCHSEHSEESQSFRPDEMLHFVQHDKPFPHKGHALKFRFVTPASNLHTGKASVLRWLDHVQYPASAREVIPSARLPHNNNYFLGNDPAKWAPDCGNFLQVTYRDVWEGIDVEFYDNGGRIEFDFVIQPGADPTAIALRVDGLTGESELTSDGQELLLPTSLGELRLELPEAFQSDDSGFAEVPAAFTLWEDNILGVALPEGYEAGKKLVIDPLVYSTYLGGEGTEYAVTIDTGEEGEAIIGGWTRSENFPAMLGGLLGGTDGFVSKFDSNNGELIYSAFLGGRAGDQVRDLHYDGEGGIFLTGDVTSADFPISEGAFQPDNNGNGDVYVAHLDLIDNRFLFSTYIGGSEYEHIERMNVSADGIDIATTTRSDDFPTTEGVFDREYNGGDCDVTITRLNMDGRELLFSSFLGGSVGRDFSNTLCPDGEQGVVVAGFTESEDFPITEGAFDETFEGDCDGFICRFDGEGELIFSTLFGGDADNYSESVNTVVSDGEGGFFFGARGLGLPTTEGAFNRNLGGGVYIGRLNDQGDELLLGTYIGSGIIFDLCLDRRGTLTFCGLTRSNEFPVTEDAFDRQRNASDAFVARLSFDGDELLYSSFFGGSEFERATAIRLDERNRLIFTGDTRSEDFPITDNALQENYGGDSYDAFFTVLDIGLSFFRITNIPDTIEIVEGELAEFMIDSESSIEDAEIVISYESPNLPDEAEFEDHGDGSGTFTWQTDYDDAGLYHAGFTLSDGENELPAEVIIIVNDVEYTPGGALPIPDHYYLSVNFPNPFNALTRLRFGLPIAGEVTLDIWDTAGRRIGSLASGYYPAGRHEAVWDATDLPDGMYIVRMTSAGFSAVQKIILLR